MSEFTFTDANFADEVLKAKGIILVDIYAPWCGPCKMMAPTIEKLATEYAGKAKIGKLNLDENIVTGDKYGIQSIPTTLLFKDGELVDSLIGFQSEEALRQKLEALF